MILLDTRTVLWVVADHPRLGPRARTLIRTSAARYVSAVTYVELAIRSGRGTLRLPEELPAHLASSGFEVLALEERHAAAVNRFAELDGHDVVDRVLVAQAAADGLVLLTADRTLLDLDQPWIRDASR